MKKQPQKGRREATEEPVVTRVKFPNKRMGEMFGRVVDIYGNDRMQIFCEDGKHRIGRIRGKIKKSYERIYEKNTPYVSDHSEKRTGTFCD